MAEMISSEMIESSSLNPTDIMIISMTLKEEDLALCMIINLKDPDKIVKKFKIYFLLILIIPAIRLIICSEMILPSMICE